MEKSIIFVVGTRPDAIKLIPVYKKLRALGVPTLLCATNQHKQLLDQVFGFFDVVPDHELNIMNENQSLAHITTSVLQKITEFFVSASPRLVVIQGDTSSSYASALASFYLKIPVAHVEAGLRTGDINAPFPEELNRIFITKISSLHFAPAPLNVLNLLKDGASPHTIFCVGNTVVDALFSIREQIENNMVKINEELKACVNACKNEQKRIILLTIHRRESFGGGTEQALKAIVECAQKYNDFFIFFPIHPNPNVLDAVASSKIRELKNVFCLVPIVYYDLIFLLLACEFVITDSGGIQEEAVSLGKRVLILRTCTERIETIWENMGKLVGTNRQAIVDVIDTWHKTLSVSPSPRFIYGDGNASGRIVDVILNYCKTALNQKTASSMPYNTYVT